jgi:alpha-tubulin suppressor-like RCC1 family protein
MRQRYIVAGTAAALLLLLLPVTALAAAKPKVSLTASPHTATIGQSVRLSGTVAHPGSSKSITILKYVAGAWKTLATTRLSAKHSFTASVTLAPGSWRLRAQYKSGHLKVYSATVTIKVLTWTAISCGWAHTMALKSDGTLWAWGSDGNGQLGLGTSNTADRDSPTEVDPGTTWKAVAAGYDFTLAIRSNGTLWAWGDNTNGELGLGSTASAQKDSPTEVDPGTTWKAVSAGYDFTLAIRSDGTLWAWGDNDAGQLGLNNGDVSTTTPSEVELPITWAGVAAGYDYTVATQSSGTQSSGVLWGCGNNDRGQLGLGSTDEFDSPTEISASTTMADVAVSGTDWYTLAVGSDGSLWACGHNDDYQLGLGDTNDRDSLTRVGSASGWTAVAAGYGFNLALRSDGSLWTWGSSSSGNLGLGVMSQTVETHTRVGSADTWKAVACGYEQSTALRSDGSLWTWGDNFYGELGLGNWNAKDVPTEVK